MMALRVRHLLARALWAVLGAWLVATGACAADAADDSLTLGFYRPVVRDVPRKDVEISLRFWLDELGLSAGLMVNPVQFYDSLDAMRRDADAGKIQLMVASAMGFAQKFSPQDLADGVTGFKNEADSLLMVVRRDAGIRTFADIYGKRIVLLEEDELTDVLLETLLMKASGKMDWGRLGDIARETRSVKLLHRLFFDSADVTWLYRSAYEAALALNPQIGQRLQVINEYSFMTRAAHTAFFSSRTSLEYRKHIIEGALRVGSTARGKQVLKMYQSDVMAPSRVSDLQPYWDLLKEHRALKAGATADKKSSRKPPP